jgi:hypothetical protein
VSNSFFLPAASVSHTSTLNAERGQLSIAAARMAADMRGSLDGSRTWLRRTDLGALRVPVCGSGRCGRSAAGRLGWQNPQMPAD